MNIIDIITIIIVGIILYIIIQLTYNENFDVFPTNVKQYDGTHPFFMEEQFHQDYRDILDAFYTIMPDRQQIFNKSDLKIKTMNPDINEIKSDIDEFINDINDIVMNHLNNYRPLSWGRVMPDKNVKSGWDKQQDVLGIPANIYDDEVIRAPIKLIKIDHLEKYSTAEATRYIVYMIVQKLNVSDQMVLKVSFYIPNKKSKKTLEEIFVVGYLSNKSFGEKSPRAHIYDYENMNYDKMTDQKTITDQLIRKQYELLSGCNNTTFE